MRKICLLVTLILTGVVSFSQSTVELQIQLLTQELIGQATLDRDPFFDWMKKVNDEFEAELKKLEGDRDVLLAITVHKKDPVSLSVSARPAFKNKEDEKILAALKKIDSPHTLIVDYSLMVIAELNEGCKEDNLEFSPAPVVPEQARFQKFHGANLKQKKLLIQDWIKNDVIPVVAHFQTTVDPKFEGVIKMGELLQKKKFGKTKATDLTDKNPDYWRATLEMSIGNQLVVFAKACMLLASGEFDRANRLLVVLEVFSDKESLVGGYLPELKGKLGTFNTDLGNEINKGVALHDKGEYENAVNHYNELLKDFPRSAWLNYEHYFSKSAPMKKIEDSDALWNKSKAVIYDCDPLYHMDVRAKTGKQGYLLFRRQEINSLFKVQDSLRADMINYADIALELEDYGFAAQLYWIIISSFSKEEFGDKNMIAHFLYCLDKLGDKETIKNFKGDFVKEFAKVENERELAMKSSMMYKAFKSEE